jgi:hypothetical protein
MPPPFVLIMNEQERKKLVEAAMPLEVLCGQIRHKAYKEMTKEFQSQLLASLNIIRELLFHENNVQGG